MKTAGGVVSLIGGVFAVIAALITLSVGSLGAAFKAEDANLVVALGYGGLFFAFLTIILGAVTIGIHSRVPGFLLIVSSLAGAVLGGTFVAVCMLLPLVGGLLAAVGGGKRAASSAVMA